MKTLHHFLCHIKHVHIHNYITKRFKIQYILHTTNHELLNNSVQYRFGIIITASLPSDLSILHTGLKHFKLLKWIVYDITCCIHKSDLCTLLIIASNEALKIMLQHDWYILHDIESPKILGYIINYCNIDINFKYNNGYTILTSFLIGKCDCEMICELIKLGADVNMKDGHDLYPLYYALQLNDTNIFIELLKNGAQTNVINNNKNLYSIIDEVTNYHKDTVNEKYYTERRTILYNILNKYNNVDNNLHARYI